MNTSNIIKIISPKLISDNHDNFFKNIELFFPFFLITNLFLEPSTRTQSSFAIAALKLNLSTINLPVENSSLTKGESLLDTCLTLEAMGVNLLIIRLKEEGVLEQIAPQLSSMNILCAGEGKRSHPTQVLLDLATIYEHHQKTESLNYLFIGDCEHSRVYHSYLDWFQGTSAATQFNVLSTWVKPTPLLDHPRQPKFLGEEDLNSALESADVVYLLRPQLERHQAKLSTDSYLNQYGLTLERMKKLKPNAIVLHPGPFYRGVEFDESLLSAQSPFHHHMKIWRQVYWSVPVRMKCIQYCLGQIPWKDLFPPA
jgi:aspartate carbamoyltransferase catalytic subunit